MYQCTHGGSRGRRTESVDALRKGIEAWNMDPDIEIILVDTLLYITGERHYLPHFTNITLHSDILCIGWMSIILIFIPTSLVRTQQTYFIHIGRNKWDSYGSANSSQKYGNLSTSNGSTAENSCMQEENWTITPRNSS